MSRWSNPIITQQEVWYCTFVKKTWWISVLFCLFQVVRLLSSHHIRKRWQQSTLFTVVKLCQWVNHQCCLYIVILEKCFQNLANIMHTIMTNLTVWMKTHCDAGKDLRYNRLNYLSRVTFVRGDRTLLVEIVTSAWLLSLKNERWRPRRE